MYVCTAGGVFYAQGSRGRGCEFTPAKTSVKYTNWDNGGARASQVGPRRWVCVASRKQSVALPNGTSTDGIRMSEQVIRMHAVAITYAKCR